MPIWPWGRQTRHGRLISERSPIPPMRLCWSLNYRISPKAESASRDGSGTGITFIERHDNMMRRTLFLILLSAVVLPGCSMFKNMFKDEEVEGPAELVSFKPEVSIRRQWSVNVGSGQGDKYNTLMPAIDGGMIYAAGSNGVVVAVDRESGRTRWRKRLKLPVTGGVGVGSGLVLVGSENSQVVALEQDSGDERWRAGVSSEVLSAPKTNGRIVVVQTVDGKLIGLNVETGAQVWIYESTVPALSLRGTSSPLIVDDFVLSAHANGTVVSVAADNGTLRWEQRVSLPTGRSEIDRMVDIDGELYLDDGAVLVSGYHGYLVAIDVVTGQKRWQVKESSYNGGSAGFGNFYMCDEKGHVKAYRAGQDEAVWVNDKLDLRPLSAPISFGNYVAVGDFEGYVHVLSQVDGRFVGRTRVERSGVRANMLARGDTLYVFGNGGRLVALQVR
ncbi:MAG: outer membrane protein assembly factor BamB [Pseudomonadales bacterium]|nr:outer membrane protein assembly factor BamB [Pseudomonadales bacterium]